MKPEWKTFLADAGAEFEDDHVANFGNPEREKRVTTTGTVICDLSHHGLIAAYGDEAQAFLQGQFSNDVHQVGDTHSQLSSYCSPKGRMLALFRLFMLDGTYYLRLPRETLETTLKRLRMYVLMSKVTLEDASDALVRIGVSGPDAETELSAVVGTLPRTVDEVVSGKTYTVIRINGPHPRFEVYGQLEAMTRLWDALNVHGAPVGASSWALLDILAGVPTVHPQTSEAFVPQMANLELIGGVSFKKGCYPGQEIVARMQYLGKNKRRMYRVHIGAETRPAPGEEIYAKDQGEPVGKLVDAQAHPDGGYEGLAVLLISAAETGEPLRLGTKGPAVELGTLPYDIPAIAS
ncbi:MAG: folate-binding protein YgfZ [Gammaproteobacteria bacterium]